MRERFRELVEIAVQNGVGDEIAVAAHARKTGGGHQAYGQPRRHQLHIDRPGQTVEVLLGGPQKLEKHRAHAAAHQSQYDEPSELRRWTWRELRHLIPRFNPEKAARNCGGHDRGADQRRKQVHGKIAEHDQRREHRAGDGGVVGRRNARRRAAAHQHAQAVGGPVGELTQLGRQGGG